MQGAALTSMVGWLSFGNKKFEHLDAEMRRLIPPLNNVMQSLVPLIDADTNAFNGYMVRSNETRIQTWLLRRLDI